MMGITQNILMKGKYRLSVSNIYVYTTRIDKCRTVSYVCMILFIIAAIYRNQAVADHTDISFCTIYLRSSIENTAAHGTEMNANGIVKPSNKTSMAPGELLNYASHTWIGICCKSSIGKYQGSETKNTRNLRCAPNAEVDTV